MPAPSPAAIVTDPPPLNSTSFPYRVNAIDLQWLATFAGVIPLRGEGPDAPRPLNPHRYA